MMNRYSGYPEGSTSVKGSSNNKIVFMGQEYEGVFVSRRGQSSLSWPKPKLKFSLPFGKTFKYADDAPPVTKFGLQSHYFELGERSYMKDLLGVKVLAESGVPVSNTFHLDVRLNGEFFGLFSFVEMIDLTFLQRVGLAPPVPPLPYCAAELANLRWDILEEELPDMFELRYPRDREWDDSVSKGSNYRSSSEWAGLADLTKGLAGGGETRRSQYVMENLALPSIINEMAAQAVILNMDRCTKNFFMYLNPKTEQWHRIPWDLDGSLGQSNGLGGVTGNQYCVLACEQWNSPLYCDSEHSQDQQVDTPYGPVTVTMNWASPWQHSSGRIGRRSMLQTNAVPLPEPQTLDNLLFIPKQFPEPEGWDKPDRDTTGKSSLTGAPGTYNHLTDAVLDVPATRAMYLRRLRTLAEIFLSPGGRLEQLAEEIYIKISRLAELDAEKWNTGIRVEAGFIQITKEFVPARRHLLLDVYGPRGSYPLLPSAQPQGYKRMLFLQSSNTVTPRKGQTGDKQQSRVAYVQVYNPSNADSVDMSSWQIHCEAGGEDHMAFVFEPGTVLPPSSSVYVAQDIYGFRASGKVPAGALVVGPLGWFGQQDINKTVIHLTDSTGVHIDKLS
ncbi:coth protein-domain-containing protein [Dunaliella salina]|uniref:Coth protein-domain-containing protein n=1 Tax=Dunaliella salina TaxID=3046 RepID=A0ABQ7GTT9_DUNSA|nr:coth protein-domain-containing protein [Dunaliella salina]|eukprot:KAF5838031.1 coth protein-domain-containing protein [Dunaliella salina]